MLSLETRVFASSMRVSNGDSSDSERFEIGIEKDRRKPPELYRLPAAKGMTIRGRFCSQLNITAAPCPSSSLITDKGDEISYGSWTIWPRA